MMKKKWKVGSLSGQKDICLNELDGGGRGRVLR